MKGAEKWITFNPTLILLCLVLTTFPVMVSTGGAKLTLKWEYDNPGSLLENGRTCDLVGDTRCDAYIEFCMREAYLPRQQGEDCQILKTTTTTVNNVDHWSASMEGDHIAAPIPTHYTLEATIYDSDVFNTRQKIGDFVATSFMLRPTSTFTPVRLERRTYGSHNPDMKLNVEVRLTCFTDYYGDLCDKHCLANSQSTCDLQGNLICHPGFQGERCQFEDACYFEPCAEHAQCANRQDRLGRVCQCNGGEGPECYPGYDPCQRNPCENNGTCTHTGSFNASFTCNCTFGWAGHRCSDKLTACKAAELKLVADWVEQASSTGNGTAVDTGGALESRPTVCLNGGTCYDHADQFDYRCVCLPGWSGDRCEAAVLPFTTTQLTVYMLSIAIPFGVALIVIILVLAYRYRRSRRVLQYMSKAGGIVYFNRDSDTISLNNGKDYQTHYIDRIYRDMKAGSSSITAKVTNPTRSEQNTDSEVYDECNPLGLDTGSNAYGTIFDVEQHSPSIYQAPSVSSGQDCAPPLPDRSYPLSPSPSVYHQSLLGSVLDNATYRSTRQLNLELSPDYSTGSRTSRVYRPISPPAFIPGSVLDRIENSPKI